jgi:membrane-bound ClpP family serine protease
MTPFFVLAVGLLLIYLEFYLPGGIMGTIGALVVLGSIIVFALLYDSPILITLYTIGTLALLVLLFRYALWRIRHAPAERSIYSEGDQEGYVASSYNRGAVGKIGVVDTDLKPGGHIIVEGKRHLAISQSGYIVKGAEVRVTGGVGESLTVKNYHKEEES